MPVPNPAAMEFFLTRRSRLARTLTAPVPTRDELMPILTAAVRVPDHGKLEPWRFIVLEKPALMRLPPLPPNARRSSGWTRKARRRASHSLPMPTLRWP